MSERFAKQRPSNTGFLSYASYHFDNASWPCDGHECPSYIMTCHILQPTGRSFFKHSFPARVFRRQPLQDFVVMLRCAVERDTLGGPFF